MIDGIIPRNAAHRASPLGILLIAALLIGLIIYFGAQERREAIGRIHGSPQEAVHDVRQPGAFRDLPNVTGYNWTSALLVLAVLALASSESTHLIRRIGDMARTALMAISNPPPMSTAVRKLPVEGGPSDRDLLLDLVADARTTGSVAALRAALACGLDATETTANGTTILHDAVLRGTAEAIDVLVTIGGADPSARTRSGRTPLRNGLEIWLMLEASGSSEAPRIAANLEMLRRLGARA